MFEGVFASQTEVGVQHDALFDKVNKVTFFLIQVLDDQAVVDISSELGSKSIRELSSFLLHKQRLDN